MITELRISRNAIESLWAHLIQDHGQEEAALLLAGVLKLDGKLVLIVREWIPVPDSGFQTKDGLFLQIDAEYLAPVIKRCRYENASLLIAHSHPFSDIHVGFSGIDDSGENALIPKIQERVPGRPHGAIVFGKRAVAGRVWLPGAIKSMPIDKIRIVGERLSDFWTTNSTHAQQAPQMKHMHDRQILAVGKEIQGQIYRSKIAIIGAGGLGSQVFTNMVHAGIGHILLVDDDHIEEPNRSRIIASMPSDVALKTPKVEALKRYANETNPDVNVDAIFGSIEDIEIQKMIRSVDTIFCCTDTLASRGVLNRLSYQYLIPMVDIGMDIQRLTDSDDIHAAAGRVMLIQPDGPCLECMEIVTGSGLEREYGQRPCCEKNDGNRSIGKKAASSILFNGVVGSLAVIRYLDLLGGWQKDRMPGTYEYFQPLTGIIKQYEMVGTVKCNICKEVRGFGDDLALPGRLSPLKKAE